MKVNSNPVPDVEPAPKGTKPEKSGALAADMEPAQKEGIKGLMRKNKFWAILCVVLFAAFLFVNSNTGNTKTLLTVQLRNLKSDTAMFEAAIKEVEASLEEQKKIDALKLTDEEAEMAHNHAMKQGELVAELQNSFRDLNVSDNKDEYTANVERLGACFDEKSKEARVPWYGNKESVPGTWEFASKAAFRGNNAKVLWLCYSDDDHILLAYCTAIYNADTKVFTKAEWKLTRYAEANIGTDDVSGDATGDNNSEVISMVDHLKSLVDDGTLQTTGGDINEDTINESNELSNSRDSLKSAVEDGNVDGENYDPRYGIGLDDPSDDTDNEEGGGEDEVVSE